jgi:membrane dipeptidase
MVQRRRFLQTAGALLGGACLWPPAARGEGAAYVDGSLVLDREAPGRLLDDILEGGLRACIVPVGDPSAGERDFGRTLAELGELGRLIGRHPRRLLAGRTVTDLDRAETSSRLAVFASLSSAGALGEDLSRLERVHQLGVRILPLTHDTRNAIGDGYREPTNAGLTRFGLDLIERMNKLGMLVDVSRCGDATASGAIFFSTRPVTIAHAGCRAIFDHPRNKSDNLLRALAEKGGVVGIFQVTWFLGADEPALEQYLRHIDHAIDVAGIEHVGIGTDHDYRPMQPAGRARASGPTAGSGGTELDEGGWPHVEELAGPRHMEELASRLRVRGRSAADVDKILGLNFRRLFGDTLK